MPAASPRAGVRSLDYDSPLLDRAADPLRALGDIEGTGIGALLRRLRLAVPWLLVLWLRLPRLVVELTETPEGRLIHQHLSVRQGGRWRYRWAQGVLLLEARYEDYLRGRRRQAVRTNIRRARDRGLVVEHATTIPEWTADPADPRAPWLRTRAALEVWYVRDRDGAIVADAELTVDRDVALLHLARSTVSDARWLLHAAIVERLCGRCRVLLTNTEDVPLQPAGSRHYQRLLGYSVRRVCPRLRLRDVLAARTVRVGAVIGLGALLIVANVTLAPHPPAFGERIVVWLAVIGAVRRRTRTAGPAAATAALAAAVLTARHGPAGLPAGLAFLSAGVLVDAGLAVVPRLTWSWLAVTPAGVLGGLVATAVVALWALPPGGERLWIEAALGGGVGAGVGWGLGGLRDRRPSTPPRWAG